MEIRKNIYRIALMGLVGLSGCEVANVLQRESDRSYRNQSRTQYYSGGRIIDFTDEDDKDNQKKREMFEK